jgi:hypothetical protein
MQRFKVSLTYAEGGGSYGPKNFAFRNFHHCSSPLVTMSFIPHALASGTFAALASVCAKLFTDQKTAQFTQTTLDVLPISHYSDSLEFYVCLNETFCTMHHSLADPTCITRSPARFA